MPKEQSDEPRQLMPRARGSRGVDEVNRGVVVRRNRRWGRRDEDSMVLVLITIGGS